MSNTYCACGHDDADHNAYGCTAALDTPRGVFRITRIMCPCERFRAASDGQVGT